MPWILLLISLFCFFITFSPGVPLALTVILLLAALGFMLAAVLSFLSSRLQSSSRDDSKMISPDDLRKMREQAAARKAADENSESSAN
jgi:uncharacterized membrane protein YdfJ with MMPL/SSD domain